MKLYFEDDSSASWNFDPQKLAEEVIRAALDYEKCPFEAEVSLSIVDNDAIREYNRNFRQIDSATDVLSFPMNEFSSPADYRELPEDAFDPESGELVLGDIVISAERAEEQAEEYGHSLKREYSFLIVHSVLHLLGYDHMTPEDAAEMESRQEAVLQRMGITRE